MVCVSDNRVAQYGVLSCAETEAPLEEAAAELAAELAGVVAEDMGAETHVTVDATQRSATTAQYDVLPPPQTLRYACPKGWHRVGPGVGAVPAPEKVSTGCGP